MTRKNKPRQTVSSNIELMKEWDYEKNEKLGYDPNKISACSKVKVFWKCPVCGQEWTCSLGNRGGKNSQVCPGDCNKEIRKINKLKGIEKSKKTNLERYGVENPFQAEIFKEKLRKTNLEKYGFENPKKSDEVKNKTRNTCIERYGVDHPNKLPEIKNKAIQTCIDKYGVRSPSQVPEFKEKKIQTSLKNFGKPYHLCKEHHEKGDRAEYHRKYNGGFTGSLKKQIKKRDNNVCQYPDCNKNENLCVHHIDNIKSNNDPKNLITLCHSCHSRITVLFSFNKEYYINLFKYIIDEKYIEKTFLTE